MKLYVFVKGISEAGEADQNRIDLIGYICKQPLYRETPLGKEITDILIAKLYACCGNQEEFPREPITIDTNKMSELLEGVFIKAGLLEVER